MESSTRAVGIDIGGTKMGVALVTQYGEILKRCVLPTDAPEGFDRAMARLGDAVATLLSDCDDVAGIGMGCAGAVDAIRGTVHFPHALKDWHGRSLRTPLETRFRVPVTVENDANAAALGECLFGAGRGASPVAMLTLGTGVGGAVVVDGRIYRGAGGLHPEIGHLPLALSSRDCYCGRPGCLESLASGTAIAAAGREAGFADSRAVFTAARNGDFAASRIVQQAAQAVAMGVWTLCHTFLPARIVLGGGMMDEHFDAFEPAIREQLKQARQFPSGTVQVVPAALKNEAGVVGAASLALR